ncbi:MAG: rod shape-determining protein MreD [Halioglobus sp.]
MVDREQHGLWIIWVSFLVASILAVVSLPEWLLWARPEWVALVLIYWTIALPHRVGLFTGLIVGVGLDAIEGAVFGQNAFSLMIVSLLSQVLYQRLRVFNVPQQSGMVFMLIGVNQLICQWVQNLQGTGAPSSLFLLPAISSALMWPVVFHVLRSLRRSYRIL